MTFAPEVSAPPRSSLGPAGASVPWRSDINSAPPASSRLTAHQCIVLRYSDALSPEWPRQLPTPKTPAVILRYTTDNGWTCASPHSLLFHHCASIGAGFSSGCFFSHRNMNPTRTVGKVTRLQWPFLTLSSHVARVRSGCIVLGPFDALQGPGAATNEGFITSLVMHSLLSWLRQTKHLVDVI